MTLPVVFTANGPSGYNLTNSLRFRASASAYLNRTPASTTNRQIWTWSAWVKQGSALNSIFSTNASDNLSYNYFGFDTNAFRLYQWNGSGYDFQFVTTPVYRDPAAWYHFVIQVDTTQATAANRVRLYVNGVQVTAFSTNTTPSQNLNTYVNNSSYSHLLARNPAGSSTYFDGYLAEVNFIDGQALTPSSFGQTSSTTGVWQPIRYTGTYGTNGFYLPFTDNSALTTSSNVGLGKDFSGNANYWTTNNISITSGSTYDSMTDVPTLTNATTANYPVLSPIDNTGVTISNANLTATTPSSNQACKATMSLPTTGKFYFEVTDVVTGGGNIVGIANVTLPTNTSLYLGTGSIYVTMSSNAVFGLAFNFDALTYTIYKNNSVDSTGSITSGITYIPFMQTSASGGASTAFNFGQRPFAYTPPTGFVALNTFNLTTPTIGATASTQANDYFNVVLYTGNGSTNAITGVGFQPDWTWIKGRSGATDHGLYDAVRGVQKQLESNNTDAETTETTGLTTFGSDGFTVGALAQLNTSSATYVGWNWKANGAGSSNTAGSITSTVSANTTAGFSIVTYTGTGANATVGHGLNVAPSMVIVKNRGVTDVWCVYHSSLGNTQVIILNRTDATVTATTAWNSTSPTSSVFSIGTLVDVNRSTNNYVAYCFAQVAGYSAFGSYVGNGVADGPFIYTGFRPKYFILKNITSAQSWSVQDTSRSPYNVGSAVLLPNSSSAELTGTDFIDIVSNGFKIRHSSSGNNNNNGDTYIYMAFAESPFKYANAR
jgi:hypothetical protein